MKIPLLGGMSARRFLRDYWQKQPLLVRGALPEFGDSLSPDELAGLACEEDAQSRLVLHQRGKWRVEHGPFAEQRFAALPARGWSLLVQGVNHFLPEADALLHQFDFIPRARLDDVMVSYAPDGGGVGPHFDSYDVFLLQGYGQRLWRVSAQTDHELAPHAPLRILKNFQTDQEWALNPGDMLYLPPQLAHWGVAMGECMTWSIGFRAPSAQELATQFLGYLQENLQLSGLYADPDLRCQSNPADISEQMVCKVQNLLKNIRWGHAEVADFLGRYLTEPKAHIVFERRRISPQAFQTRLAREGVRLNRKTQMLMSGGRAYINGEAVDAALSALPCLRELARQRGLPPATAVPTEALQVLRGWYRNGYISFH